MAAVSVDAAYRACEEITRTSAGNFFYGIRLLPRPKRQAMCAVYALARRIDDIGDGELAREEKLRRLAAARADLAALGAHGEDPVLVAVADARERCGLPIDAFGDLVDGVETDVLGTRLETFDELVVYCRRVAGSIGRLCVAVFGASDRAAAMPLADDLGVAMQLTNILRDVREDLDRGRVYLPAEDLRRFGAEGWLDGAPRPALEELVRFEAGRARAWFHRGLALLALLDGRSAACVGTMSGIYERILDRIEAEPGAVLTRRVALAGREKTWVALRSLAAGAVGPGRHGRGAIAEVAR